MRLLVLVFVVGCLESASACCPHFNKPQFTSKKAMYQRGVGAPAMACRVEITKMNVRLDKKCAHMALAARWYCSYKCRTVCFTPAGSTINCGVDCRGHGQNAIFICSCGLSPDTGRNCQTRAHWSELWAWWPAFCGPNPQPRPFPPWPQPRIAMAPAQVKDHTTLKWLGNVPYSCVKGRCACMPTCEMNPADPLCRPPRPPPPPQTRAPQLEDLSGRDEPDEPLEEPATCPAEKTEVMGEALDPLSIRSPSKKLLPTPVSAADCDSEEYDDE